MISPSLPSSSATAATATPASSKQDQHVQPNSSSNASHHVIVFAQSMQILLDSLVSSLGKEPTPSPAVETMENASTESEQEVFVTTEKEHVDQSNDDNESVISQYQLQLLHDEDPLGNQSRPSTPGSYIPSKRQKVSNGDTDTDNHKRMEINPDDDWFSLTNQDLSNQLEPAFFNQQQLSQISNLVQEQITEVTNTFNTTITENKDKIAEHEKTIEELKHKMEQSDLKMIQISEEKAALESIIRRNRINCQANKCPQSHQPATEKNMHSQPAIVQSYSPSPDNQQEEMSTSSSQNDKSQRMEYFHDVPLSPDYSAYPCLASQERQTNRLTNTETIFPPSTKPAHVEVPKSTFNSFKVPTAPVRAPQIKKTWASRAEAAKDLQQEPVHSPASRKIGPQEAKQKKVESIFSNSKLTVGFRPITLGQVNRIINDPINNIKDLPEDDAKKAALRIAVNDFLGYELNMPQHEIEALELKRIFFPKDPASRTLYIELKNEADRSNIFRRAKYIKKHTDSKDNASIEKYIPPQLYNRYSALERYCHALRTNRSNPLATNIRLGNDDFELRTRLHPTNDKYDPESKPDEWAFITPSILPPLPAIDLGRPSQTLIQAPGRPNPPSPPTVRSNQQETTTSSSNQQEAAAAPSNQQEAIDSLSIQQEDDSKKATGTKRKHNAYPKASDVEKQLKAAAESMDTEDVNNTTTGAPNKSCQ